MGKDLLSIGRTAIIASAVGLLLGCTSAPKTNYISYKATPKNLTTIENAYLKLPAGNVNYSGLADYDGVNANHGSMLYQGGAVGLLAGIFTHAAISENIQNKELQNRQKAADAVLKPFEEQLSKFTFTQLRVDTKAYLSDEEKKLFGEGNTSAADQLIIESKPVFLLAQNRKSLILQNAVAVYYAAKPKSVLYTNMIEVVSKTVMESDPDKFWLEQDALLKASVELFSRSLKVATVDLMAQSVAEVSEKTYKYTVDDKKVFERGTLVKQQCDYIYFRNLRGWLKAVPQDATEQVNCSSIGS